MPIAPATLAALADTFVSAMTSIRGRRIRRLPFAGAARVLGTSVVEAHDVRAIDREALAVLLRGQT